jgi:hypothetical protein
MNKNMKDNATTISFGTHKGKTYELMCEKEKSYCMYVLKQKDCYGAFKNFQDFLKKCKNKLYDVNELKKIPGIKCTDLINYMVDDINVINIINNIKINTTNQNKIRINNNIESSIFGQFIDYLIRFEISKTQSIKFEDSRTECMIYQESINDSFEKKLDIDLSENDDDGETVLDDHQIQLQSIKNSYYKLQTNCDVVLKDVLNTSIAHSLFFREIKALKYVDYDNEIMTKTSYKNIITYVNEKVNNKKNILLNPGLGNDKLQISADADLIIDNELIDIKVSNSVGLNINDFIQLLVYATLYHMKTNIVCNKISIYNPILGVENYIIIDLNMIKKMLVILKNYEIGSIGYKRHQKL